MRKFKFISKYGFYLFSLLIFLFLALIIYSQRYMDNTNLYLTLSVIGYVGALISLLLLEVFSRYKYFKWETEKNVIEGLMTFRHNYLYVNGELKDECCLFFKKKSPLLKAYVNTEEIVVGYSRRRLWCTVNEITIK